MNTLESEYLNVHFVHMTGHLDGSGESGTLNENNEKIQAYARENNKILFNFADIESYDPDRLVNYKQLMANDNVTMIPTGTAVVIKTGRPTGRLLIQMTGITAVQLTHNR